MSARNAGRRLNLRVTCRRGTLAGGPCPVTCWSLLQDNSMYPLFFPLLRCNSPLSGRGWPGMWVEPRRLRLKSCAKQKKKPHPRTGSSVLRPAFYDDELAGCLRRKYRLRRVCHSYTRGANPSMTLAPAILRRWLHGSLRWQLSPTFNTENPVHGRDPITAQGSFAFVRIQHVLRWSAFKRTHLSPETMSMTTSKMMDLPPLLSSGVHDTCVLRLDRPKSSVTVYRAGSSRDEAQPADLLLRLNTAGGTVFDGFGNSFRLALRNDQISFGPTIPLLDRPSSDSCSAGPCACVADVHGSRRW